MKCRVTKRLKKAATRLETEGFCPCTHKHCWFWHKFPKSRTARRSVSGTKNPCMRIIFLANSAFSIHPLCLIIDSFVPNADFRLSFRRGRFVSGPRRVLIIKGWNVGERVAGVKCKRGQMAYTGKEFSERSEAAFQESRLWWQMTPKRQVERRNYGSAWRCSYCCYKSQDIRACAGLLIRNRIRI